MYSTMRQQSAETLNRPRVRRICVAVLFCLSTQAAGQESSPADRPSNLAPFIQSIHIDARDIFDPEENAPFAGLVNFFHIRTQKHVIRRELLFHHRQRLDRELVAESERNLRALGLFVDVDITAEQTHPDSVALTVLTRDRWSTKLNTSYRLTGGVHFFGASLVEDNLLGLGKTIDLGYNKSSDRTLRILAYRDNRLLGSRLQHAIKLQNNSDFDAFSFSLQRPFFAWQAKWGFDFSLEKIDGVYRRFRKGELVDAPGLRERAGQFFAHFYRGRHIKRHIFTGIAVERSEIGEQRRRINMIGVGFGFMHRHFREMRNLDSYEQTEDVPAGALAEMATGLSFTGAPASLMPYVATRLQVAALGPGRTGFSAGATWQTFVAGGRPKDLLFDAEVKGFHGWRDHLLVARMSYTHLANFSVARQLHLGEENGLRGYRLRAHTGTRMFLINFEDRLHTDLKFYVFRLGLTVFADFGAAWQEKQSVSLDDLSSAFGIGLRIGNARFTGGIHRIDFAYNTGENRWRVSISLGSFFSAISRLDFMRSFLTERLRGQL